MALGGPDAQCLEHALTMTERERDEARAEVARLKGWQQRTARCVQLLLDTPYTDDAGLRGNLRFLLECLLREAEDHHA
jgi:hypothetical protein